MGKDSLYTAHLLQLSLYALALNAGAGLLWHVPLLLRHPQHQ